MKYIIPIMVTLLLLSTGFVGVSNNIEKSTSSFDGKTLYVGGSGEGNYTKIQDAIDDASDGDTVFVYNGTYVENLVVNKSINLIGEDRNITTIEGSDNEDYTVYICEPHVRLTGFTIQKGTRGGILIDGDYGFSHSNTIYGNTIRKNNVFGILLGDSSNNNIYRNNITNHNWGIFIQGFYDDSSNNSICQNNIMKNKQGIQFNPGMEGDACDNRIYQNNFFCNSIHAIDGGSANQWDNGSVGNYWYNYRGKDNDGDGIGDTPYWISYWRDKKDNYPLMEPYGNITSYNKNNESSSIEQSSRILFLPILHGFMSRFPLLSWLLGWFLW